MSNNASYRLTRRPSTTTSTSGGYGGGYGLEYKPLNWLPNWEDILDKPLTYAPSAHTHAISEVDELQTALDLKLNKSIWESNISYTDTVTTLLKSTKISGDGEVSGNLIVKGEATTYALDGVETNIKASGNASYLWELLDVADTVRNAPDNSILVKQNGEWVFADGISINCGDYKII